MRNRVPQPDLDRGKKETLGQKVYSGPQCPNIMPLPHNDSRTVHNRHEPAPGLDQTKTLIILILEIFGRHSDISIH